MNRRELLKTVVQGSVTTSTALLLAPYLEAAQQPAGQVALAFAELQQTLTELEADFSKPEWRIRSPQDAAEARRLLLHTLVHALQAWMEADPSRPFFTPFIGLHKKMLGDNPDARYFSAAIDDQHSYRIYGNLADATYTSFTIEMGLGSESQGLGSTLNDTEFEADSEGNYEIILSAEQVPGNWMPLPAGAQSVTTRHYYERVLSVGKDPLHHIPVAIANLEDPGPRPAPSDAGVAAGIRRVSAFMRQNVIRMDNSNSPDWVSRVPNQFVPPQKDRSNEAIAYAAKDNVYAMAPFLLQADQALVIRGRFPRARFGSVLLHNQFLQTFDYETRTISLNREQIEYESDGSFAIVVAHRDPGVANWLDTEGRMFGIVFWRFLMPEEPIAALETEIISL